MAKNTKISYNNKNEILVSKNHQNAKFVILKTKLY